MNFATLQGLTIPEGVVTQIADASGRVLWKLETSKPVVLEVAKITSDTYAGETLYEDEQFIALNVFPKTNGTVSITYGGLTKTITDTSGAEEPNAQQVFFGTFNGVSDSVATPASGELVIEGEYSGFSPGTYQVTSKGLSMTNCACIIGVVDWGDLTEIPSGAFNGCKNLTHVEFPKGITNISGSAFYKCTSLALTALPDGIISIGSNAFYGCTSLALDALPSSVETIDTFAFADCCNLNFSNPDFLPHGLKTIGNDAFSFSQSDSTFIDFVDTFTIPETVTYIGDGAFTGPVSGGASMQFIKRVIMLSKTPPTLGGKSVFSSKGYGSGITIVVPVGSAAKYKADETWIAAALDDSVVEAS